MMNHDPSTNPIWNVNFMRLAALWFLVVAVIVLVTSIVPLASAGQQIATIDPNAASTQSVEDFAKAALSGSQLQADPPQVLEIADNKDFIREFIAVQWRPA